MRVFITGWYHSKNLNSLLASIKLLNWTRVSTITDANLVFSGSEYIDPTLYQNTRFIFGPHFCILPYDKLRRLANKNSIYIQPSMQVIVSWNVHFSVQRPLKLEPYAFGVDTDRFSPSDCVKDRIFIYYKRRDPRELQLLESMFFQLNIQYSLVKYGEYEEADYISLLDEALYGIWLGSHESQGFALEEALSMNVPLLVWSSTHMDQEYGCDPSYMGITTPMITAPYWDNRCGEVFYNQNELMSSFNKFRSKLLDYEPRKYIMENLTMKLRAEALDKLVKSIEL